MRMFFILLGGFENKLIGLFQKQISFKQHDPLKNLLLVLCICVSVFML